MHTQFRSSFAVLSAEQSKRPFLQCDRESAAAWRAEYYLPNGTFYSPVKAKQNTVANKKIHYWQVDGCRPPLWL